MTGRTHDLAAFSGLLIAFMSSNLASVSLVTLFLSLLFNQVGGILPDIDQPTAPFWRNLPIGHFIGKIVDKVLLGGHRFLTHSLLGVMFFGLLFYAILLFIKSIIGGVDLNIIFFSFIIGLLSHLLLDSFTKEGIPLLLPVTKKFGFPTNKRFRITTGKFVEHLVVVPIIIILDIVMIYSDHSTIINFFRHNLIR